MSFQNALFFHFFPIIFQICQLSLSFSYQGTSLRVRYTLASIPIGIELRLRLLAQTRLNTVSVLSLLYFQTQNSLFPEELHTSQHNKVLNEYFSMLHTTPTSMVSNTTSPICNVLLHHTVLSRIKLILIRHRGQDIVPLFIALSFQGLPLSKVSREPRVWLQFQARSSSKMTIPKSTFSVTDNKKGSEYSFYPC